MIRVNDLKSSFELYRDEYEKKALSVLRSGWYVLGSEVESFEREFAAKLGSRFVIGVDNGLNAISLGINALGIGAGDEVILQSNSYIATVLAVTHNGAVPVFVEPDEYYNIDAPKIEDAITPRTKAVLITHLYGQASDMAEICAVCERRGITLLEDCAQAHFARFGGKKVGTFGKMGFFSFYPTKNLGAFGDGGAISTDDEALAEKLRALRNYGSARKYYNDYQGFNSRLDELQAGLLRVKLSHIDEIMKRRAAIAERYLSEIRNEKIALPKVREGATSVWHLFVITAEDRDGLKQYLADSGVGSDIHYPVPPHLSKAYECLGYKRGDFPAAEYLADHVLSLPIYEGMPDGAVSRVIEAVNAY